MSVCKINYMTRPQQLIVLLIAILIPLNLCVGQQARSSKLLTDFSNDLPESGYPDATVTLRFIAIREIPKVAAPGDVFVTLGRTGGKLAQAGGSAAADYNQKSDNTVSVGTLAFDGDKLKGTVKVKIGPDAPRPRVVGFPNPADEFEIEIDAMVDPSKVIDYQPEATPFMPPWRSDEPQAAGKLITGTYVAKRGTIETRGKILGAIQANPTGNRIGGRGNIDLSPDPAGGAKVLARMSPKRVGSNQAMAIKPLGTLNVTDFDAVRVTITSEARRDDVSVMLALQTGGQWRTISSAAFLLGREATFDVPFDDFGRFDPTTLTAVGIGVDNPHGVGDVSFSVRKIELVNLGLARRLPKTDVTITFDPNTVVSLNATTDVPKGLFGFHDVGESQPRVAKPGEEDPFDYLKRINPGYLRPLVHVGFNAKALTDEQIANRAAEKYGKPDDLFTRRALAGDAIDNVVMTHTNDLWNRPAWMDAGIEKSAEGVRAFYRDLASRAWRPGDDTNYLRRFEVWNEPFMWARHTNMGKLNPVGKKAWEDPTQFGYLPGRMNADAYATFFLAAVEGAKSANPHVLLGGPSTAEFGGQDYATLSNFVGPILDRVHDKIDFLTEHHYGGDPQTFAASYQVTKGWCDVKYDRRIPIYNTECNDLGASAAGKARYNMLDILTCIRQVRDIAQGRAVHALWNGYLNDEGELHCFDLLATLRGKVLDAASGDDEVTVVATQPQVGEVVVVALNHGSINKRLTLPVPEGFTIREVKMMLADAPDNELQLRDTEGQAIPKPAAGKTTLTTIGDLPAAINLPRGSAVRWTLVKAGHVASSKREIDEHFTDAVLAKVSPNAPLESTIKWRGDHTGTKQAWLRVVTSDVHRGEAVAVIGGKNVELPYSSSNEGASLVQDIPIDVGGLDDLKGITFKCNDPGNSNGFTIWSASICLER